MTLAASNPLQRIAASVSAAFSGASPGEAEDAVNKRTPAKDESSIGEGVTTIGGFLETGERSGKLSGQNKYVTYSEILSNTSIVAAGTRYFLNILTKSTWKAEPARGSDGKIREGAQEYADAMQSVMEDMNNPWFRAVRRAAMYRYFGFSVQEWTTERKESGLIGFKNIAPRPQVSIVRWDLKDDEVLGCWQELKNRPNIYLPRRRIIHVVDDALNDSPEGLGLYRHLVRPAERLRAYEELEEVGFETDLRGIPIGRAPLKKLKEDLDAGRITEAQRGQRLHAIKAFIQGHIRNKKSGVVFDSTTYASADDANRPSNVREWDVELLQGQSSAQEAVASAITRLTSEMARVLNIEHLMLGSDGAGSLALGEVKTSDFYMIVESTLLELRLAFQKDAVRPIAEANGWPREMWPTLKTDTVQFRDVQKMAAALRDMAVAGATLAPDDPAILELRDLLGLSRPPTEIIDREVDALIAEQESKLATEAAKVEAIKNPPDKGLHGNSGQLKTGAKRKPQQ